MKAATVKELIGAISFSPELCLTEPKLHEEWLCGPALWLRKLTSLSNSHTDFPGAERLRPGHRRHLSEERGLGGIGTVKVEM